MASKIKVSQRASGFTLLELMITVLVVVILGAIIYPTFMQSIYKSRRTEAKASLTEIQQAAERWRSNNPAYPATLSTIYPSSTTKNGYYTLAFAPSANGTGYSATATAAGVQLNDTQCLALQISMGAGGLVYSSSTNGSTFSVSTNDPCWPQ